MTRQVIWKYTIDIKNDFGRKTINLPPFYTLLHIEANGDDKVDVWIKLDADQSGVKFPVTIAIVGTGMVWNDEEFEWFATCKTPSGLVWHAIASWTNH